MHLSETMRRPLRKSDAADSWNELAVLFERCRARASWVNLWAAAHSSFSRAADHKRRLLSSPYQTAPQGALLRVSKANGCD